MTYQVYFDKQYKFMELTDPKTGAMIRTSVLDEQGNQTDFEPFRRSFPFLMDIGIMGQCSSSNTCKVGCYQQGAGNKLGTNMPLDFYKRLIDEAKGKVFEVALGGFGNPNEHPDFVEIVRYTRENGIVPNYTTAGNNLTAEQILATKKYCGSVAVSEHRAPYTLDAIQRFVEAGVPTNLHYVLGNDSIDEAIDRLEKNDFPSGIKAVIFLLYKPVGKVKSDNVLRASDPRVKRFYELIESEHPFACGLDACNMAGVVNFSKKIMPESMSPCDGGRFSMYVTPDGFALPCSFDTTTRRFADDLKTKTILEVWNGEVFAKFSSHHEGSCSGCAIRENCMGGCPLMGKKINLCESSERDYVLG